MRGRARRYAGTPRVGMVGAGQLARMTYQAGISLGVTVRLLASDLDDSAARVGARITVGSHTSLDDLRSFADTCDVLTFDHELVSPNHLATLEAEGALLRPSPSTLLFSQDKGYQRTHLSAAGFPVPRFAIVSTLDDVAAVGAAHGWPVVLKATRGGYDGRGVWMARDSDEAATIVEDAARHGVPLLVEEHIPIDREVALLVARRPGGEMVVYPVVQTLQVDGMCREIVAPASIPDSLAAEARQLALRLAEGTEVVGIMAVELFETGGRLVVNELAFRPHNSGHYSIEGCVTSQFENHLRAVMDLPLGDASLVAPMVATVNFVGGHESEDALSALHDALKIPGACVHLYGKKARPGRKLGHVTVLGDLADDALERARRAADILAGRSLVGVGA